MPGAPCDGTPHHHGDMGQGAGGGRGTRGGHVLRAAGRPGFGMNYPPAVPLLWGCWRRGHVLSGPQTHTQALSATTRLCVRQASHNSYSAFSTNARIHTHTLREDELGQLGWSNSTATSAAGH